MDDRREEKKITRGLYRGVRISVRTLDILIVIGIVVLAGLIIYGISSNGYTLTYNSRGGSDVASQSYEYGDLLILPENPQRQGYVFEGWAEDENCIRLVDETYEIQQDTTLYACWAAGE